MDKRIVFATIHNGLYLDYYFSDHDYAWYYEYFSLTLINNVIDEHNSINACGWASACFNPVYSNNNSDNIQFMTNSSYDYSDGLWEALNSNRIASPEINDFVEEYISSHPEEDIIDNDSPNIVNPNTLANAFVVLFILLIITISSSFIIVKNKKSLS